ncbi:MAG TPA: hypothetical protein DCX07_15295 [Phycisphaerales bacterium]|nr:hypothetical protein [Phycisphaerales bacterium]
MVVIVRGGVADVLIKPKAVAVTILDYDVQGADAADPSLAKGPDDQFCRLQEWPADEGVGADGDRQSQRP